MNEESEIQLNNIVTTKHNILYLGKNSLKTKTPTLTIIAL